MNIIDDFANCRMVCVMSEEYKEEANYTDEEFIVTVKKNENESDKEKMYNVTVELNGEINDFDVNQGIKNLALGLWDIRKKEKI